MTWVQEFEEDIVAREQVRGEVFESVFQNFEQNMEELKEIFVNLLDGSVDPGDLGAAVNAYWKKFGSKEVEVAQKEVEIQRRLAGLYERLAYASLEEWEAYARTVANTRFRANTLLLRFLRQNRVSNDRSQLLSTKSR